MVIDKDLALLIALIILILFIKDILLVVLILCIACILLHYAIDDVTWNKIFTIEIK